MTLLQVALERLLGIDAAAIAAGRLSYTRSAREAIDRVDAGDGIDAAFLLDPTPVASISAVARDGDVMPQKSTYFFPKAAERPAHQPSRMVNTETTWPR